MSFKDPKTIYEVIKGIENNHYLLPGIQREFEWNPERICWLFDSLLREYPIGSFLFWHVEAENKDVIKSYKFIKNFKEHFNTHNEPYEPEAGFTAVLDGQQRLNSLLIGLTGTYAWKTYRMRKLNNEKSYPTRKLYLDLNGPLEGRSAYYNFKFLTEACDKDGWFLVSDIIKYKESYELLEYVNGMEVEDERFAHKTILKFHSLIFTRDVIHAYHEKSQDVDKALDIFIRMNSAGKPLSFEQLLTSLITASWPEGRDALIELEDNIEELFSINRGFILKSFLYLFYKDIAYKVHNFTPEVVLKFKEVFPKLKEVILEVFKFVESLGYDDRTLKSLNVLIPIVYFLYHSNQWEDFSTKVRYKDLRDEMGKWIKISLIRKVLSGTSDNTLRKIRQAFTSDVVENPMETPEFSIKAISNNIDRDLEATDEFLDKIMLYKKDNPYTFSILSLLYPQINTRMFTFHIDHIHPDSSDITFESGFNWLDTLPNLQLLEGGVNCSKRETPLVEWIKTVDNLDYYMKSNYIPDVDLSLDNFVEYHDAREATLRQKLKEILSFK